MAKPTSAEAAIEARYSAALLALENARDALLRPLWNAHHEAVKAATATRETAMDPILAAHREKVIAIQAERTAAYLALMEDTDAPA